MVRGLWGEGSDVQRKAFFSLMSCPMGVSPPVSLRCAGSGGDQVETQMEPLCDFAQERRRSKGGAEGRRVGFRERVSSRGVPSFPPSSWGHSCPLLLPGNRAHLSASSGLWFRGPEGEEAPGSRVALADTRPAAGAAHLQGGRPRGPVSTPIRAPRFCSDRLTKQ